MRTHEAPHVAEPRPTRAAGYEVLRRLGRGSRADVLLGAAGGRDDGDSRRLAAVKVVRPGVSAESVDVEVDLLSRGVSPHVIELIDLGQSRDGTCLVLQPALSGSAAKMAASGEGSPGRAVTLLISVVQGLERVHEAGFAHGSVRADRVLVVEGGRPVLIGFGHAIRGRDLDSRAAFQRLLDEDRLAFAALCRSFLAGRDSIILAREIERRAQTSGTAFFPWVESELFRWADPLPLLADDLGTDLTVRPDVGADDELGAQIRTRRPEAYAQTPAPGFDWDRADREHDDRIGAELREAARGDPSLELLRTGFAGLGRDLMDRVRRVPRRRRRLIGATIVAAVTVTTMVVLLLPGSSAPSASAQPPVPEGTDATHVVAPIIPAEDSFPAPDRAGGDPLAVLPQLLLDTGLSSDRIDPARYVQVQRVGDFAVVTGDPAQQNQPPPILLERSGDGWRLRDSAVPREG